MLSSYFPDSARATQSFAEARCGGSRDFSTHYPRETTQSIYDGLFPAALSIAYAASDTA